MSNAFRIFNYFPNRNLKIEGEGLEVEVNFGRNRELDGESAAKAFGPDKKVRLFISPPTVPRSWRHLCTYKIHRTPSAFHVGQVTTRFSGGTWDDQILVAGNAVQGRPYVRIHNATNLPLRLNNNIYVDPNSMYRYQGRHHFGVPLGIVFTDDDRRYAPLRITKPVTDIYYGIVSEHAQPIYGGWQKVFSPEVDYSNYYDAYGHVESL